MISDLWHRLSTLDLMPHGQCYLWYPEILWLHVISDGLIGLAYYLIPIALIYFTSRREEVPFRWMFYLFSLFIFACGTTHLMNVWVTWYPDYLLAGIIKLLTAGLSIAAAGLLIPLLPRALALRSPGELETLNQVLANEINERKQAEKRFRSLLEAAPDAVIVVNNHCRIVLVNSQTEKLFGYSREALLEHPVEMLLAETSQDKRIKQYAELFSHPVSDTLTHHLISLECLRQNGSEFPAEVSLSPLNTEDGPFITAAIRDISERREVEETLHQAQKMEAVGQLTGGIAHDFNNLLTIISGNLQILQEPLQTNPALSKSVKAAAKAAQRGAELTHKLLAYSRRQSLKPQLIDLNQLIFGFTDWLHRTLGEHIEIETIRGNDLWTTLADPQQVETALLNLVLNARDAMPQGGKLTIETTNRWLNEHYTPHQSEVIPGRYVMLSVRDTGSGMTSEILNRAFEPFFTTKQVGKGSGMGLSMVYGFIKQSGGHIKTCSQLGHGTTVELYLPAASEISASTSNTRISSPPPLPPGQEIILVVEDEEDVRDLAVLLLTELGYRVLEAADGQAALALLDQEPAIDLLFTDVVLPGGLNGFELAREARRRHPELRSLFTSGYAPHVAIDDKEPDKDGLMVSKPYTKDDLAQKIRQALHPKLSTA